MNELVVDVKLYGKNVGLLSWNEKRGLAEFQYYPDFFRTGLNVSSYGGYNKTASHEDALKFSIFV